MASHLYLIFVTQLFISKVLASYPYYIQQRTPQYTPSYKQYYQPNYPNYSYSKPKASYPVQNLPALQNCQPNKINDFVPSVKYEKPLIKGSEKVDSNVLNNLAIALQLLIVNNIMNNPPKESNLLPISEQILEIAQKHFPAQAPGCPCDVTCQMPNAKFLSSSNFGDDGMLKSMAGNVNPGAMPVNTPVPRSSLGLISPYDALSSSFRSPNGFLSPYASMSASDNYKDLFSLDF